MIDRRQLLFSCASMIVAPVAAYGQASLPPVAVTKDPDCGCCSGWVSHLRRSGFPVTVTNDANDLQPLKTRLGVPDDLAACHTAVVAGYAIEGHVPAPAIKRLLSERPAARGLAVPGMPAGSPGMGAEDHETFEVTLFGDGERRPYGRYRGDKPA